MGKENCHECNNKDKRLKVLQADIDFEIKKMTEDLAEEKVRVELQYQKEYKKIMERYTKEKQERQQENKKWLFKYDSLTANYQKIIKDLHQEYRTNQEKMKNELTNSYKKKETAKSQEHSSHVETLKKEHEHVVYSLKEVQSKEIRILKKHEEDAIKALKNTYQDKILSMKTDYQTKVSQLKKQIEKISDSRDELKKEASQKQTYLYEEIYQRKEEISSLKYKIDHLDLTIKNYQEEIQSKNNEVKLIKETHKEELNAFINQFETQKTKIIEDYNKKIQQLLIAKLNDCTLFEENVKDIQDIRSTQTKIYESSIKEVKELVEVRPSRDEDVEKINVLQQLLNQKEKQIQKVMEEVKSYKLELDYKQSTFNRIFHESTNKNMLSIEKIVGKKKDSLKPQRTSLSLFKGDNSKYNSVNTIHSLTNAADFRKDRQIVPVKSLKMFH